VKLIKFDLPVDGIKVKNLDELRDHFTLEVVGHFRSGLLVKWLKTRGELSIVDDLNKISSEEDRGIFEGVCTALGAAADKDVLDCIFLAAPEKAGKNLSQFDTMLLRNEAVRRAFSEVVSAVLGQRLGGVDPEKVFDISVDDVLRCDCGAESVAASSAAFDLLHDILRVVNDKYPGGALSLDFFKLLSRVGVISSELGLMERRRSADGLLACLRSLKGVL
jgi:hypothetical protein